MRGFFSAVWTSLSRTQCRFRPIIICFVRVIAKPQDESHDYGHGKVETMASFFVGFALVANAWHHRSDALSSIGATIGIGGAILLGDRWTVLDPLASIVVGAMLVKVAVDVLRGSMNELTESSLPPETEHEIEKIIRSCPDVCEPHNLRTRRIGNRIAIEAHICMDGNMTFSVAHDRATDIENLLKERFGAQTHVTLHMEPTKHKEGSQFSTLNS